MKTIRKIDALPQVPRCLRVAAYARVSVGKDATLQSLSAQVSYYNTMIQRHIEWEFVGVYADEAVTGTKDNRKEFQRLLADCRAGKIDMIITKSVTRFARNTVTTLETVRELKLLGIDVYFEKEKIHSTNGDGELMLSILASYAQEESRSVSENCKWRIRKGFQQGKPHRIWMYGYRQIDGQLQIVPEEAEIVRWIFKDYLSGLGMTLIAKKLINLGVPTRHGTPWNGTTIAKMLRNEKYVGNLTLQKQYIVDSVTKKQRVNRGELPKYHVTGSHEAIIDPETFERVQEEAARRSEVHQLTLAPGASHAAVYPFSGLIRCGQCGKHYHRKYGNAGTNSEKVVWLCAGYNIMGKQFCSAKQVPELTIMEKSAEVLGLATFDPVIFAKNIVEIQVPVQYRLTFVFQDGHTVDTEWKYPPRGSRWTNEKRQRAREYELERRKNQKLLLAKNPKEEEELL